MSRILVTGGTGFLGKKLLDRLSGKYEVIGANRRGKREGFIQIDITKEETIEKIKKIEPDIVIHTAAISSPDKCLDDKEKCWGVNVGGTYNVVLGCKKSRSKLIYLSSAYVFKGGTPRETTPPSPANYYGLTKLEGERAIQEEIQHYVILRPTTMYGWSGTEDKFLRKVKKTLSKGKTITLSPNIIKRSVLVDDVVQYIALLIEMNKGGVYHISGRSSASRYRLGRLVARTFSLNEGLVLPGPEKLTAQRPKKLSLLSTKEPLPKVVSLKEGLQVAKMQEKCILNSLYFKEAYQRERRGSVALQRERLGELLAKYSPALGDIVCPIPLSGYYYAIGYSKKSGAPLELALYKEREKRTLFTKERKIGVIKDLVKGKRVIVVDESVFTGASLKQVAVELKKAGAAEIHGRIIYSPLGGCRYRVLEGLELMGAKGIEKELGLDSIGFLDPKKYPESLQEKCTECWLGIRR